MFHKNQSLKKIIILIIATLTCVGCGSTRIENENPKELDLCVNILKNHYLLYKDYKNPSIILNAAIKDIKTNNSIWQIPLAQDLENLELFTAFCNEKITHTQSLTQFKNLPGKDPWGEIIIEGNKKMPSYKKLLPSEMIAMSKFSGNISGKCTSIAQFISSYLRVSGISADDIFLLRMKSHTIGVFKYENSIYIINNNSIEKVDNLKDRFKKKSILWNIQ